MSKHFNIGEIPTKRLYTVAMGRGIVKVQFQKTANPVVVVDSMQGLDLKSPAVFYKLVRAFQREL